MLPGWSIFRPWPTSRGKTKCFIWAVDLMMGSMAFCISGGKQYRQQRAAFWAGLCICRQHCAVNGINVRKIIRCLLLPQFAVRQRGGLLHAGVIDVFRLKHQFFRIQQFGLSKIDGKLVSSIFRQIILFSLLPMRFPAVPLQPEKI